MTSTLEPPREMTTTAADIVDIVRRSSVTRAEAIDLVETWGKAHRMIGVAQEAVETYNKKIEAEQAERRHA